MPQQRIPLLPLTLEGELHIYPHSFLCTWTNLDPDFDGGHIMDLGRRLSRVSLPYLCQPVTAHIRPQGDGGNQLPGPYMKSSYFRCPPSRVTFFQKILFNAYTTSP